MVHALRQANRVLKDDGYLLDLRPAPTLRHVGIEVNDSYKKVVVMRESLDESYAADQAVKEMVKAGYLKLKSRNRFECTRRMANYSEFKNWLEDPMRFRKLRSPERLLKTVKESLKSSKTQNWNPRIVVHGPIDLRVLTKSGCASARCRTH